MGGAYGMRERGEKSVHRFDRKPKERDHSEDRSVGGKMGSELILETLAGGV
jgi:peptide subunit release factor 1 (eRF1)